jgi:hypothetical protein
MSVGVLAGTDRSALLADWHGAMIDVVPAALALVGEGVAA